MRKPLLILGLVTLTMTAPGLASAQGKGKSGGNGQKANKGQMFDQRQSVRDYSNRDDQRYDRRDRDDRRYASRSCPPGLAKKNNGCLPPGIAKKRWGAGDRFPTTYRTNNVPAEYRDQYRDSDQSLFRYADGNVYRISPTTRRVLEVITPLIR